MALQYQIRRGTASLWTSSNPVLLDGEMGLETDTRFKKLGNGVAAWNALPYDATSGPSVTAADKANWNAKADPGIAQNSQSANYTAVLADANKHLYHPAADTAARTWTIPASSAVAFPVGTAITFDNDFGAGAVTIAITTDTLVLVGTAGTTGSRTLASGGQATALKVSATRWRIAGNGLT